MPISFNKPSRPDPLTESPTTVLANGLTRLNAGLDPSNRAPRSAVALLLDPSDSVRAFMDVQLQSARDLVKDLQTLPATARSVVLNVVQIGTPPPSTGFREIETFEVPVLVPATSTPLHFALDRLSVDFGDLFGELRRNGIDRTESVAVVVTDGHANGCPPEEVAAAIKRFHLVCRKWLVTPVVVGVGESLNESVLKALATTLPPFRLALLNADRLLPFVQKVAVSMSTSRRGDELRFDLPAGAETLG